jgi:hypothetical protein
LGIASNEFTLSDNKDGTYTGYYNGEKFTGSKQEDVLN